MAQGNRHHYTEIPIKDPFCKIEDKELIGEEISIIKEYVNIGEMILTKLKNNPNFIGEVDAATGEVNTFQDMRKKSIKCALWLQELNVKPGDIITVCTHNRFDAYVPYLAALYIGAITNPWPKQSIKSNVAHFLTRVTPKIIFADCDDAATIRTAVRTRNVSTKIVVFDTFEGFNSLESILNDEKFRAVDIDKFSCANLNDARDPAIILLSSGTTGFLRDVEIPHAIFSAPSNNQTPIMRPNDVGLWFESLYRIISLLLTVRAIISNVTAIKSSGFNNEHKLCKMIKKYKVTWMFLETDMCHQFSKWNELKELFLKNDFSFLKQVVINGLIKRSIHKTLIRSLPDTSVTRVYCLPETGVITYQVQYGEIGCRGCVGANVRLMITSFVNKKPLGAYNIGTIWCRTASLMNGYYKDLRSTSHVIDNNGWFHSEDVGYYDHRGNIYVIDRVNQLIKYRHLYISPVAMEILLEHHPEVSEAVVVPMPHDHDNFRPMAFVTRTMPESEINEKKLKEFVRQQLNKWKRIHWGIKFMNEMPRIYGEITNRKILAKIAIDYFNHCA